MDSRNERAPETVSFGARDVGADEKPALVRDLFGVVAQRYDLMNDLMSVGLHRAWRRRLIDRAQPRTDQRLLDVAGGTGDIAFRWRRGGGGETIVCDLTEEMVCVGRNRAVDHNILSGIRWVVGAAEALPVADGTADLCTIAFGLRNVVDIDQALQEMRRVLRPGGRFLCLEFSCPVEPALGRLVARWNATVLPALGGLVARDAEAYHYLAESIRRFPRPEDIAGRMVKVGFERVDWSPLTGGIVAVHSGIRA